MTMKKFENAGSRIESQSEAETGGGMEIHELPSAEAVVVLGCELRKRIIRSKNEKTGGVIEREKIEPDIESKMRALGAIELWRRGLVREIIVAGGQAKEFPGEKSIAEAMEDYLVQKGVPREIIFKETTSKNTAENIENILGILEEKDVKKVILETNECRLARAKQLFGNILEKHGLKIEEAFISAEELLNERSPHYKKLTSHYQYPESLVKAPKEALLKGLWEVLHRVLIYVDREDKLAKFFVHKLH